MVLFTGDDCQPEIAPLIGLAICNQLNPVACLSKMLQICAKLIVVRVGFTGLIPQKFSRRLYISRIFKVIIKCKTVV